MLPSKCPHKSTCPLFPLFTLASNLQLWQQKYCDDAYSSCERWRRAVDGREVPHGLLPNGTLLRKLTLDRMGAKR